MKQRLFSVSLKNKTATLSVGASYSPSVSLLPSLLATFEKSHPHVQIDFRTADRAVIDRMILNSEFELAIVNNAVSNHSLVLEPYRKEPLAVFVARNHSLAKKQKITWQDLEQTPFIARKRVGGRSSSDRLLKDMRKLGYKPEVAMRCTSPEAVKVAVKRKMGMGIFQGDQCAGSKAGRNQNNQGSRRKL